MRQEELFKKSSKILQGVLLILLLILLRVWHLSFVPKDPKKSSFEPQKRSVLLTPHRGNIIDRYSLPIAVNKIQYNAAIYYAHIRQLPAIKWIQEENEKKIKTYPRKEHIEKLASFLSEKLHLEKKKIEDLIYAKASLLPHTPFIIKENLSEKEYYALKAVEKDWVGLHLQIDQERTYPQKKVASTLIGYLGSISPEYYWEIGSKIHTLENQLEKITSHEGPDSYLDYNTREEIEEELMKLKLKAYHMNDLVGKAGLEAFFETSLRGSPGKEIFTVDRLGNYLKKRKESTSAEAGKTLQLTLSIELQAFAEELLIKEEKIRTPRSILDEEEETKPYIRGGAIVVMDPKTGEILTLASIPRYDPNDFIPSSDPLTQEEKRKKILRSLETTAHIGKIWNGEDTLDKEWEDQKKLIEKRLNLSFEQYLHLLLPPDSPIQTAFYRIRNIKNAIELQEAMLTLLYFTKDPTPSHLIDILFPEKKGHIPIHNLIGKEKKEWIQSSLKQEESPTFQAKKTLEKYLADIPENKDKLFCLDICKTLINSFYFSDSLIEKIGTMSLDTYWQLTRLIIRTKSFGQKIVKEFFHKEIFLSWREKNEKAFLKEKRKEEKKRKTYQKPYIDYLDKEENRQFSQFWQKLDIDVTRYLLLPSSSPIDNKKLLSFLEEKRNTLPPHFQEGEKTAFDRYITSLPADLIGEFFKTARSFSSLTRPLYLRYPQLRKERQVPIEKDLAAAFYPKNGYNYARSYAFRHAAPLGSIFKIVTGYAALKKQHLDAEKEGKNLTPPLNPLTMIDTVRWDPKAKKGGSLVVGYSLEGKPYPQIYKGGRLPRSSRKNVGKIDLIGSLEQSCNPYFSLLAAEYLPSPDDLLQAAKDFGFGEKTGIDLPGEFPGKLPDDLHVNKTGLYSFAIGQHTLLTTPLQTAVMLSALANKGKILRPQIIYKNKNPLEKREPEVVKEIFMPDAIRNTLLQGMENVIIGEKGMARAETIPKLLQDKKMMENYRKIEKSFVGKTSSAEIMHSFDVFPSRKAKMYKHVWFGAIYFSPEAKKWEDPKLIVVVYLPFGKRGKDAAPIGSEIINKYLELEKKYSSF